MIVTCLLDACVSNDTVDVVCLAYLLGVKANVWVLSFVNAAERSSFCA